ncbi:hypothetical protein PV11_06483 [Exophiala sideris]|uniref:Uncharacterized protein n=1 Tax=Exophiala sideris TaxID=1016849 RepID=A0A0D1YVJ0_9EURO|nr:hypothetical protein PV11_06483 [Exophiala sideris]
MSTSLRRLTATTPISRATIPSQCTTPRNACMRRNMSRPVLTISRPSSSSRRPNADTQGPKPLRADDSPYPPFSFAGLGASRTVKITVLIALGIIGTAETVFYVKALWHYFSGPISAQPEDAHNGQD